MISSSSISRPTKLVGAIGRFEVRASGQGPTVTEALLRPPSNSERAAATSNSRHCPFLSASAVAKSASVPRCGVRRYPRSSALIPCALIPARSARASCESPAASRWLRRSVAKSCGPEARTSFSTILAKFGPSLAATRAGRTPASCAGGRALLRSRCAGIFALRRGGRLAALAEEL